MDIVDLEADVHSLTKAPKLHPHDRQRRHSRETCTEEVAGSMWEAGRLQDYKSSKYVDDSSQAPPRQSAGGVRPKHSVMSTSHQSRAGTPAAGSKSKVTRNGKHKEKGSTPPMVPNVVSQKNGMYPASTKRRPIRKSTPGKDVPNLKSNGINNESSHPHKDDDIRCIASKFSGMHVSLNETYTKGAVGDSPFTLPVAPEFNYYLEKETALAPEKRAKMLKKMIRRLDVDMKFGEYKTSETDSDSLSTPRLKTPTTPRYCDPDVLAWLMNQGLKDTEKYARIFAEHEIKIDSIAMLTESQLRNMGITALGTLTKLTNALVELRKTTVDRAASHDVHVSAAPSKSTREKELSSQHTGSVQTSKMDEQRPASSTKCPSSKPSGVNTVTAHKIKSRSIMNSARPSSQTFATGKQVPGGRCRPASAVSPTKTRSKSTAITRPASASVSRIDRGASIRTTSSKGASQMAFVHQSPNSIKQNRRQNSANKHQSPESGNQSLGPKSSEDISDKNIAEKKSVNTLSGLISVRPLVASHAYTSGSMLSNHCADDKVDVSDTDPEASLQLVEQQIHALQNDLSSPAAIDIILSLQTQLERIQKEVISKKQTMTKHQENHSKAVPNISPPIAKSRKSIGQEIQENKIPMRISADTQDKDSDLLKVQDSEKPAETSDYRGTGVVSMSMSKTELLREVRKQKDAHRKHIRHLESELSRLKYKDPIKNCEIPEKDIKFDLQDKLGEGAFSEVYKGNYQGSDVAVKRLKVPLSCQDKNYFAAEVSLLRELRHPRVVLLLGVCTTAHHALMVLEYMERGSLYNYLHQHHNVQFDHAAYYQIAKDMALGMNYLHRHNPVVLHLDLKSMNVLLTTHLHAKIADFGFSKLRYDADQVISKSAKGQTMGSPAWMAPELLNTGDMSTKSDVYSFSIILWEMLSRQQPHKGCSVFQVIEKTCTNKRLKIPAQCPTNLRDLIARCWNQNPARRPSFKDVLIALEKLQFPKEWRSLFAKAGIPASALDNVESTRSLIDIVTLTLEDVHKRPEDVPLLDLIDDEEEVKVVDSEDTFSSDDDWEDVTGDDEDSEACQRNNLRPSDVPKLDLNLSGDLNNIKKPQTFRKSLNDVNLLDIEDDEFAEIPPTLRPPSYIPPLLPANIPPPPPPLFSNPPSGSKPDLLKHTTIKTKCDVHDSFLNALQSALGKRPDVSNLVADVDESFRTQGQIQHGSDLNLRASQLRCQKQKLKSTKKPHPCQLQDLSKVPHHTMTDLFSILKKAVDSRRLQLVSRDSYEESQLQSGGWSLTGD